MNIRRNEPCFCGSGKRYKNCHGALPQGALAQERAAASRPADAGAPRAAQPGADEGFERAARLHEKGELDRARESYEAILRDVPGHMDALTALGVLHAQQKNLDAAERLLRQALRIDADAEVANSNLAAVLCDLGKAEESLPYFEKALALDPRSSDALNNRGCALAQLGRRAEALLDFRKAAAITPDAPDLLANLGNCLAELGELESALEYFDRALRWHANHIAALIKKSDVLNRLRRYPEAHACADSAVLLAPDSSQALNNRGIALRGLGRFKEALASHERALALDPHYVDALINRGAVLQDLKRHEEALASFDAILALEPDYAAAHHNRGNVLQDLARHEEALAAYERALALKPDFVDAQFGRGNALRDLKRREEALAAYERALALRPDYADVHVNAGLCRLQSGDFERGWRDYEWRWRSEYLALKTPGVGKPAWDGSQLDGALLAWGEQGLGDQILYLGMLPELAPRARRLIVAVESRLVPLAQRSFPAVEVVPLPDAFSRSDFDRQVPLGSIGTHLRRRWADFPRDRPAYLKADPARSRQLRDELAGEGELVCGLSWFSTNVRVGRQKSIRLGDLRGMLSIPGVRFVDLQYGDTGAERAALQRETGLELAHVDAVDNLNDIDGVAALINACNIVMTVSNTTAHLAGALGKRVVVMLPFAQGRFWYWHDSREDSPWYPSARLFRQPAIGDWASVVDRVTRELKQALSRP
jgi:tetratricopeptide (TPR) repeat protein